MFKTIAIVLAMFCLAVSGAPAPNPSVLAYSTPLAYSTYNYGVASPYVPYAGYVASPYAYSLGYPYAYPYATVL